MTDFTVHDYGADSSGRTIFMTAYMHDWLVGVLADLDFVPVIVQGAFMTRNGGGATESAGYHDLAGCLDFRTWNLTPKQLERLIRTLRRHGAAAWRRDAQHGGFDAHCHIVLGTDRPLAPGAAQQWRDYIDGLDGLASHGRDYEARPDPLVLEPPEEYMPLNDVDLAKIRLIVQEELTDAGETIRIKDGSSNKRLSAVLTEIRKKVMGS